MVDAVYACLIAYMLVACLLYALGLFMIKQVTGYSLPRHLCAQLMRECVLWPYMLFKGGPRV